MESSVNVKRLLKHLTLSVSSETISTNFLVLCDSDCSHSWLSSKLADQLQLAGSPLELTVNEIDSQQADNCHKTGRNNGKKFLLQIYSFNVHPFVKEDKNVRSEVVNVFSLQRLYSHHEYLDPNFYNYSKVKIILG